MKRIGWRRQAKPWAPSYPYGGPAAVSAPKAAAWAAGAALLTWAASSWAAASPAASGLFWIVSGFVGSWLTAFHEFFHALATWLTGGEVLLIQTSAHQGGMMMSSGGFYPLISCAGYLGCGMFGAYCVRHCADASARWVFGGLCVAVAAALLVKGQWVDGGWAGAAQALAASALVLVLARGRLAPFVMAYAGTLFLSSGLDDVATLLVHATRHTDAGLLARHLGMPFLAWPIALVYAAGMAGAWVWAARGLWRQARR